MSTLVEGSTDIAALAFTLDAPANVGYLLPIRVRAIVSLCQPIGGLWVGPYTVVAAVAKTGSVAVARLITASPAKTYILNATAGPVLEENVALDYVFNLPVQGGSLITVILDNVDGWQWQGDANDGLIEGHDGIRVRVSCDYEGLVGYSIREGGGVRDWIWTAFAENVWKGKAES